VHTEFCGGRNDEKRPLRILRQIERIILKEVLKFFLNNESDAQIIPILFCYTTLYVRASSLPIIRSFLLYNQHW